MSDIHLSQNRTVFLVRTAIKASTRCLKLLSNRAKATYPQKLRVS